MSYLMGRDKGPDKVVFGNNFSLSPYSGPTSGAFAGLNPRPSQLD